MFAAHNMMLTPTPGSAPSIAAYDAVGAGNSNFSVPAAFNFTAANGADVFVVVTTDRAGGSITGATYGGAGGVMTQIASLSHNNDTSKGTTNVYRLTGGGSGAPKAVLAQGSGSAWWIVNAISFTGVATAGTPTTAFGSGTSQSQSVSGFGLQVISSGNGGAGNSALGSFSGVTNRSNLLSTGSSQALSTTAGAGTASSATSTSTPWACVFVPIS